MASYDEKVDAMTARGAKGGVPGVILSAVTRDGTTLYHKVAGFKTTSPDSPALTFDNTLTIFSCTKLITCIAALQCVERGLITLDEDVTHILPELASLPIISPNPNRSADDDNDDDPTNTPPFILTEASPRPTLRQLLTHSNGHGYDMVDPLLKAWRKSRGEPEKAFTGRFGVVDSFSTPLLFEPGRAWSYGSGIDWAGLLVGRLNGNVSLESYMETNIWKPLGMGSTTFHPENHPHVREKLVPVSRRDDEQKDSESDSSSTQDIRPVEVGPGTTLAWPAVDEKGGGGLITSVPDFMAVLRDLLRRGEGESGESDEPVLLKKETLDLFFSPQFTQSESEPTNACFQALNQSYPAFAPLIGASVGTGPRATVNYGLGGLLMMDDDTRTGPDGAGSGMRRDTLIWGGAGNLIWFVNRKLGLAAFYASQVLPPGDRASAELIRGFIDEVWKRFDGLTTQP